MLKHHQEYEGALKDFEVTQWDEDGVIVSVNKDTNVTWGDLYEVVEHLRDCILQDLLTHLTDHP